MYYSKNNVLDRYEARLKGGSYALLYPKVTAGAVEKVTQRAHKTFEKTLGSCYLKLPAVYSSYLNGYSKPWSKSNLERIKKVAPQLDYIIYISTRDDSQKLSSLNTLSSDQYDERIIATIEIASVKTGELVYSKSLTAWTRDEDDGIVFMTAGALDKNAVERLLKRTAKALKEKEISCK